MKSGIYKIVNMVNGKVYVGSTNNFARRWSEHKRKMRAGVSRCARLQAAWIKYGESRFEFEVVEVVAAEALLTREQFWMDALQPAYNVAPAAGSQSGTKHSPETRALLSRITKISQEQRAKMVAGIRAMTPEAKEACRQKQSAAHMGNKYNIGNKHSPESNAKRSAAMKGRAFTEEHRARLKANHWRTRESIA